MSADVWEHVTLIQQQRGTKERPLEALAAVVELRAWCDQVERELVEVCREPKYPNATWFGRAGETRFTLRQIAVALGRSKSSVHRQYGDSWADAHASIRAQALHPLEGVRDPYGA